MTEPAAALPRSLAAVVFDAYGTLFDLSSIAGGARDALGDDTEAFALLWRRKQLEYTWLRALMGDYADFWQVTGEALDYALAAMGRDDAALRARLMQRHMNVPAYPDVVPALAALRARRLKTAILTNGSPHMITAAVNAAELRKLLDQILSVDAVLQAASDGLCAGPRRPAMRAARHRLRLGQWLGRRGRGPFRLQGRLAEPRQVARRAPASAPRARDRLAGRTGQRLAGLTPWPSKAPSRQSRCPRSTMFERRPC